MTEIKFNEAVLDSFCAHLQLDEKSKNTIDKYVRDVKAFGRFIGEQTITKELVISFKEKLLSEDYAVRSINSMIASLNSFLSFVGCEGCRIKSIREQRQIFCPEEKELTKAEYDRLLNAAERIGMEQAQYRRYERGENEIKVNVLIDICVALNVASDYILGLFS